MTELHTWWIVFVFGDAEAPLIPVRSWYSTLLRNDIAVGLLVTSFIIRYPSPVHHNSSFPPCHPSNYLTSISKTPVFRRWRFWLSPKPLLNYNNPGIICIHGGVTWLLSPVAIPPPSASAADVARVFILRLLIVTLAHNSPRMIRATVSPDTSDILRYVLTVSKWRAFLCHFRNSLFG